MVTQDTRHHGLGDPTTLEQIDTLFACGAGEYVNIPQIVVVGDQSSGKSSVLSGLIRKDLPRDSGLCTRFATKIVFRRDEQAGVRVSIIPDENATLEHRQQLAARGDFDLETFDNAVFVDLMKKVHKTIGIRNFNEPPNDEPTFSRDVLQLEISGPHEEHLSVIDVPGIFRDPTPGQTTKDDIKLVRDMVHGYMENPRSVMLAVLPANVDVATQEILQLSSEVDPEGDRTLGVLTKPDLVDSGAEHGIIALIKGEGRRMKLGWHVLRNPGKKDLADPSFDRQQQEDDFFRSRRPWNSLDSDSVGIEALRIRLKDVLSNLVRREFTKVKSEVQKKLSVAEVKLKSLGPERNSRASQAAYLTGISADFQHLVDLALSANFGTDDRFNRYEALRIAPAVVLRMNQFRDEMATWGHTHSFDLPNNQDEEHCTHPFREEKKQRSRAQSDSPTRLQVRKHVGSDDVEDLLQPQRTLSRNRAVGNTAWLRELHQRARGFELGTFDPAILSSALSEQTTAWRSISFGYVSDIANIIHTFICTALSIVCASERLERDLYHSLVDDLRAGYSKAMDQAEFIITVEINGIPVTQNLYFEEQLEKRRLEKLVDSIAIHSFQHEFYGDVVKIDDIPLSVTTRNENYLVQDIHTILQTYYEVCRTRFVDNVCKQATDHFLVNGRDTPLRVFTPVLVSRMTDEQLERIAKEETQMVRQRTKLTSEIESLRKARKILT